MSHTKIAPIISRAQVFLNSFHSATYTQTFAAPFYRSMHLNSIQCNKEGVRVCWRDAINKPNDILVDEKFNLQNAESLNY